MFYFGKDTSEPEKLIELISLSYSKNGGIKIVVGLLSALPIGVIIHQISVILKNWFVAQFIEEFNDFPKKEKINDLNETKIYILERISNLNSFYYVRVDNGILAPLLACLFITCAMHIETNNIWKYSAITIGVILIIYLYRIKLEIREYIDMLPTNTDSSIYKISVEKNKIKQDYIVKVNSV